MRPMQIIIKELGSPHARVVSLATEGLRLVQARPYCRLSLIYFFTFFYPSLCHAPCWIPYLLQALG